MSELNSPPSLPSSSLRPKVYINPPAPLSPTRSTATDTFYNPGRPEGSSASTPPSPTIRSRSGTLNSERPVRPSVDTTKPVAAGSSLPRSPTTTSSSHANGILPPASFFRIGTARAPQSMSSSPQKPSSSMPYGPTPTSPLKSGFQTHHVRSSLSKPAPAVRRTPLESAPSPQKSHSPPATVVEDEQPIPLARLASPSRLEEDTSFNTMFDDTTISTAGPDTSLGFSSYSRGVGAKPSREPLLPLAAPPGTGRNRTYRTSIDQVFARNSVDTSRGGASDDLEKGLRRESSENQPLSSGLPTDSASLMNSSFPSRHTPHSGAALRSFADTHGRTSPFPPAVEPSIVPIMDEKTGKPVRNFKLHPSRNTFMFGGRALTGGDSLIPFAGTLTLIFGIAGVWLGCTVPWWWHHVSIAVPIIGAYLILVTISSLFMTAMKDPGIIPRNLDLDPPYSSGSPMNDEPPAPLPRDLRVRAGVVRVKWCPTCKIYRPPRSSHCKMCDNCVDICDHHCQWVNNCIGRRNYTHFLTFLITATLTEVYIITTSALHLYLLTTHDDISFRKAISRAPGSAVVFCLAILAIWPLLTLFLYHIRLVVLNVTTIEQVRNQAHSSIIPGATPPNPFALGKWTKNVAYVFCRPAGYSWIEANRIAIEDARQLNPGSMGRWKPE